MNALAPPPHPAEPPLRLTEAGTAGVLGRLADSGLLATGCVVVIGLDAVRDRLGAQWTAKREMVWEAAERIFARRFEPSALWARIGDADFVICADEDPLASRFLALKALRELLEFFLGAQRFEDMRISVVLSAEGGDLRCSVLDPQGIEHDAALAGAVERVEAKPDNDGLFFTTVGGRVLELGFECERIVNLRNGAEIATGLSTRLTDQATGARVSDLWLDKLSSANLLAVTSATIGFAARLYKETEHGIMAPFSLQALAHIGHRGELLRRLDAIALDPFKPVILDILDVGRGTPPGRLLEVVSALAPHCRKVIARIPSHHVCLEPLRGCRLSGVSIDCRGPLQDDASFCGELAHLVERARAVAPIAVALNLKTEAATERAAAAGATHGGLAMPAN